MAWSYPYLSQINLFDKAKISEKDAKRQKLTAKEILKRLSKQPGVVLADEVGMGKTYVSLAVAVSVALSDRMKRPVIIMVPSGLLGKWERDFGIFKEKCLPTATESLECGKAENVVTLLKLLDDKSANRKRIIILKNGAFNQNMKDKWLRLAIIKRALFNRKTDAASIYRSLERFGPELLDFEREERRNPGLIRRLLRSDFDDWKRILLEAEVINESDDAPIPKQIINVLRKIPTSKFNSLLIQLKKLRYKRADKFRSDLFKKIKTIWTLCLKESKRSLPLLILDEAHHLKNARTRFASLFHSEEEDKETKHQNQGSLEGIFERMLFLTATPFQLGHYELCSVLERFCGIDWRKAKTDGIEQESYILEVDELRKALDGTQRSALAFNEIWGKLGIDDLYFQDQKYSSITEWWAGIWGEQPGLLSSQQQILIQRFIELKEKLKLSEALLRKYVIRHVRDKFLDGGSYEILRRNSLPGDAITKRIGFNIYKEIVNSRNGVNGLPISEDALLPFLLAARISSLNPDSRPVFAEGLASSFDAFMYTRKQNINTSLDYQVLDDDDNDINNEIAEANDNPELDWYFGQMEENIKSIKSKQSHPKVNATVEKAVELWMHGEKVLIFCHYIATTKALQRELLHHLNKEIRKAGSKKLKLEPGKVKETLERISNNFDSIDSLLRKAFDKKMKILLKEYSTLSEFADLISDVVRRYFKTPSFLVRFYPLGQRVKPHEMITLAFEKKDNSGLSLHTIIERFLDFLAFRCSSIERNCYLQALKSIQTGIVQVVTGSTDKPTRENRMLTFNTPFSPDILVASSVLAEGVDLHLNCRHIIHHDLSWNPSTLEQRTGRVDRIGRKGETLLLPIQIYLPFIADTQDEKMYKVVMDRDRWFNIIMGDEYNDDFQTTEMIANKLPLPEELVKELSFNLKVE